MRTSKKDYIVIISAVPFPYGNASDNAIYTFMDGFSEHGCEGEVLCLYPNLPAQYKDVKPEGEYLGVKYKYLHGRTQKTKCKITNYLNYHISPKFLLKRYLKEKTKNYNVTAVFIMHVSEIFYQYSKVCKFLGVRVVLTTCEYPEYLVKNSAEGQRKYVELSKYIDKYIFETKTLDDYEKNALQKQIDSIVIPATMPFDDIIQCHKDQAEPYIAYSGSIFSDSKDGLSNIIKAFSLFHEQHKTIRLKFIGRISRKEYFAELKILVNSLGLQDCISFTGEVNREDYVQHMTNAELMIVAKPKDSYYGGGLSSKVIEYLFSGNPIIMVASDDYVNYLTHKENVYFTDDNQPDTLYNALCEMFDNSTMRNNIAQTGKEFAMKNFNYHILTKGLLGFILK